MSRSDYVLAHRRITRARGRADEHQCVDCPKQAEDWTYTYSDPNPKRSGRSLYSDDPSNYAPRCRTCHIAFDRRMDPEMDDIVARRSVACGEGVKRRMSQPGGVDVYRASGAKAARMRRECGTCGRICAPGPMAIHQKASGHTGQRDLEPAQD